MDVVPLSPESRQAISAKFSPEDVPRVAELLLRYGHKKHHPDCERIRRGILRISKTVADVERYVALADSDYRELIMHAEYELRDGKIRKRKDVD